MPTTVKVIGETQTVESGHGKFVEETLVTAPFTTIQNRAKVSNSLKPIMGNERIFVNSLNELPNEFGPNGEQVYESDNGDNRIRFVGKWVTGFSDNGMRSSTAVANNYVEITFYGTGLNLLSRYDANDADVVAKVDGGAYSSNLYPTSAPNILNNRKYNMNAIISVASGLTLDWHTVEIKLNTLITNGLEVHGFEILNESSQITVPAGVCYSEGNKLEVDAALLDYNLGFENESDVNVGTNGGRAVIGVDGDDGIVKKWLRKVDAAPAYLASADHSNESIYRKIAWEEFGRNRSDDFSTLTTSTSDRAFTLDDGVTTLVGNNVQGGAGVEIRDIGTSYATFTFVGTGLDVVLNYDVTTVNTIDVSVDGVPVSSLNPTSPVGATQDFVHKICSGLPYGTHTVKFSSPAEGFLGRTRLADFILYQPKKPSIPSGVVELGEYNLMADYSYVANYGESLISTGMLRKQNIREFVYEGTWAIGSGGAVQPAVNSGFQTATTTANSKVKYTFFGTGCELRYQGQGDGPTNMQVYLNGVVANDTNYPTLSAEVNQNAGGSYNISTGIADIRDASGSTNAGLRLSNLPLDLYTIEFDVQSSAGGQTLNMYSIDVITPIHTPHTTFGNMSIRDLRKFEAEDTTNKIVKDKTISARVDKASAYIVRSKGISQILSGGNGISYIYFEEPFIDYQYNLAGTCHYGDKILASYADTINGNNSKVRVDTTSSAGANQQVSYSVRITHKQQKDVFDKADEE